MKTKETIGIDVSKLVIDVCIHSLQIVLQFENTTNGFKKMVKWVFENTSFSKQESLFVLEHTGLYSHKLSVFLEKEELYFSIVAGLEIKKSLGIVRGKNDQIDARRIALYGYRLKDELKPSKVPEITIIKLKNLFSLRSRLVRQKAGFQSSLKEQKTIYKKKDHTEIFDVQEKMIKMLAKQINSIMDAIMAIIKNDKTTKEIYNLVTSVEGIGSITAITMIVYTENFTKFKTWRKFASYSGVAPFPFQSGSSIKGRNKVSHLANKRIKTLLTMCAISSIQHNSEMKLFYERRVASGKNGMSTINIIRNKLIARMFKVVQRKTPYINIHQYAA